MTSERGSDIKSKDSILLFGTNERTCSIEGKRQEWRCGVYFDSHEFGNECFPVEVEKGELWVGESVI